MQIYWKQSTKNKIISQGGIYLINKLFQQERIAELIDGWNGLRAPQSRYSDSDIVFGLSYCCFVGGDYLEDINYLRSDLNKEDILHIPSSDTVSYRCNQLAENNKQFLGKGKKAVVHQFNHQRSLNQLLVKMAVCLNPHWKQTPQVLDYDNTIVATDKGDSRKTYKPCSGYQPGVMFIGRNPVYVEGRNGNSSSATEMRDTLQRSIDMLVDQGVRLSSIRIDGAGFQGEVINLLTSYQGLQYYIRGKSAIEIWDKYKAFTSLKIKDVHLDYQDLEVYWPGRNPEEKSSRVIVYRYKKPETPQKTLYEYLDYTYFCIYTNDYCSSPEQIIRNYNNRGAAEQNFDRLKNDFLWKHPPFDTLAKNTVFFLLLAMANVLYQWLLLKISQHVSGIDLQTRMKRFMLLFVYMPCRWTYRGRRHILNIYSSRAYPKLLAGP